MPELIDDPQPEPARVRDLDDDVWVRGPDGLYEMEGFLSKSYTLAQLRETYGLAEM